MCKYKGIRWIFSGSLICKQLIDFQCINAIYYVKLIFRTLTVILQQMLQLQNISLTFFKNYTNQKFAFGKRIVGICGKNGIGKTNLLDAIYYCCFTKSYFSSVDSVNIGFGNTGFRIEANVSKNNSLQNIVCIHRGNKKELLLNEVPYDKISKHIGVFTAVMIAPDDIEIINGSGELRRKYIDAILCQADAEYLRQLMDYNKIIQQRNSLLKQAAANGYVDDMLLNTFDEQLSAPANYVFAKRKSLMEELRPKVEDFYQHISGGDEKIYLEYQSSLIEISFDKILKQNRERDRVLQRTTSGIHKDDIKFELHNQPFKSIASQGQKKSLLFSLKLAEYELLKSVKGFAPMLLLDDVFEKLDDGRMNKLLHWVCCKNTGQVFITDTHKDRLQAAFQALDVGYEIIELG